MKKHNTYRRDFLQKLGAISVGLGTAGVIPAGIRFPAEAAVADELQVPALESLPPSRVFSVLDLELPGLRHVREALTDSGSDEALGALLDYYRQRYPDVLHTVEARQGTIQAASTTRADHVVRHIFQWGPYAAADYGPDMDWSADPAGDIEWVASMYRFSWTGDLTKAYEQTGNEKYARAFVDLTTDWIEKHPLETTLEAMHPVYGPGVYGSRGWKGYAWLDLQTGIRATNICRCFRTFLHADAFTPKFLGILLASLYDHQVKTEHLPMNMVHNKAIFEQRGFFNVLHTFREYRDKDRWIDIGMTITSENLIAQTTSEGVQREWCGGYHTGVYRDALEINSRVNDLGRTMPEYYIHRVKLMADHVFGISTPDLGFPMFGDTKREKKSSDDRKTWPLYAFLTKAAKDFDDAKFSDLADLNTERLPSNGSIAFPEAGLYAMRNSWSPDQVYLALHCSPPGISTHDTPDNGTFELYAYGKWLMPDSGYFTYGNNREARTWHRQTRVHATMTCDGENTELAGRQLIWESDRNEDLLCVENQSYHRFVHRRTVWFAGKNSDLPFFVIFDEAIGDREGELALHYPMAPGQVRMDPATGRILSQYEGPNLVIQVHSNKDLEFQMEDGWHAWSYGKREKRTMVSAGYKGRGPVSFISVLVPYLNTSVPDIHIKNSASALIAGLDPVRFEIEVEGKSYALQRKIYRM